MTALMSEAPVESFAVAPFDDVALGEIALADLLARCERLHASQVQHEPTRCLVCFCH